ncbi:MAG: hypothetical protein ACYS9X_02780 [Planctomycetota bacterium]
MDAKKLLRIVAVFLAAAGVVCIARGFLASSAPDYAPMALPSPGWRGHGVGLIVVAGLAFLSSHTLPTSQPWLTAKAFGCAVGAEILLIVCVLVSLAENTWNIVTMGPLTHPPAILLLLFASLPGPLLPSWFYLLVPVLANLFLLTLLFRWLLRKGSPEEVQSAPSATGGENGSSQVPGTHDDGGEDSG